MDCLFRLVMPRTLLLVGCLLCPASLLLAQPSTLSLAPMAQVLSDDQGQSLQERHASLSGRVASLSSNKQVSFLHLALADLGRRVRWWLPLGSGEPLTPFDAFLYQWLAAEYFHYGLLADALGHRRLAACGFAESRNLLRVMRGGWYTEANCAIPDVSASRSALEAAISSEAERAALLDLLGQWAAAISGLAIAEARASALQP